MKKNITLICLAAIFLFFFNAAVHAQDTRVGLKGGAALYSTTASISASIAGQSVDEEETSDSRAGFTAGLFVEKPFSDLISAQIEALFVQKGGKEKISGDDFDVDLEPTDSDLTLSYVDVPVLIKVNIPLDGNINPFLYGGGFAGFLIDAQAEAGGQSADDAGIEVKDLLEDLNYGAVFGGGVSFGKISIDIRYDLGLANLFDKDSELIDELLSQAGDDLDEFEDVIQEVLDGIDISTSGLMFTLGVTF